MSSQDTYKTASQTKRTKSECCTDSNCESGLRNKYFDGKRLTPDSFRVEQRYSVERRWLLNRAIHGWGVVYGFEIVAPSSSNSYQPGRLKIGPGLALDKCGRELLQVKTLPLGLDDLIVINDRGGRIDPASAFSSAGQTRGRSDNYPPKCWLLSVHYAEQDTGQVTVNDPCHCDRREWDQTCETVRYSLRSISCDDCCADFECELKCNCGTGPCCDRPGCAGKRGGCRCLCEHLTSLQPDCECESLCEIEEPCGRVKVDLRNGVPLACIQLERDYCNEWTFGADIDACGPRRLVKRNDLLFDLIRGCDLTRISAIGWEPWHRGEDPVPLSEFSRALGPEGEKQDSYVTNDFWVKFSRPVRKKTLLPDSFAMTAMSGEREGGWWQTLRVPIVRVELIDEDGDYAAGAVIVVDGAWLEDAVRGRKHIFHDCEVRVEIEVRGDFIIDCNGQAVDANAVGLCAVPTGNGTPGGTFLSTFRVVPK